PFGLGKMLPFSPSSIPCLSESIATLPAHLRRVECLPNVLCLGLYGRGARGGCEKDGALDDHATGGARPTNRTTRRVSHGFNRLALFLAGIPLMIGMKSPPTDSLMKRYTWRLFWGP